MGLGRRVGVWEVDPRNVNVIVQCRSPAAASLGTITAENHKIAGFLMKVLFIQLSVTFIHIDLKVK